MDFTLTVVIGTQNINTYYARKSLRELRVSEKDTQREVHPSHVTNVGPKLAYRISGFQKIMNRLKSIQACKCFFLEYVTRRCCCCSNDDKAFPLRLLKLIRYQVVDQIGPIMSYNKTTRGNAVNITSIPTTHDSFRNHNLYHPSHPNI